jgi:hypothetical protein
MSPEEYAALLASGKVTLNRDDDGNFIYVANFTRTAVLPRDILEQLESERITTIQAHEARLKAFELFIADLKNAK